MIPTLIVFFLAAAFVLFALIFLLMRRKSMSYELIIIQDNRRGVQHTSGKYKYNLRVSSLGSLKAIKIYSKLISFSAVRTLTEIADPRPFLWYGRTVFGVIGPSGIAEDDNIVLIPPPRLTSLDIERWASKESTNIRSAFAPLLALQEPITQEKLAEYVQRTFTEKWILQNEGAGHNLLNATDILPRSLKVAYTNEIEHSYMLEAKHQDTWGKLLAFAPWIVLTIFVIGVGVSLNALYQGQGSITKSQATAMQQLFTYEQAQSYAIGHALALAHIYGYNYTPPAAPPLATAQANSSLTPSIP